MGYTEYSLLVSASNDVATLEPGVPVRDVVAKNSFDYFKFSYVVLMLWLHDLPMLMLLFLPYFLPQS